MPWVAARYSSGCEAGSSGVRSSAGYAGSGPSTEAARAVADWSRIVALYDQLLQVQATPVVALNRAVAVAMVAGPEAGLALVDELVARGQLERYLYLHSTRGELLRRLGRFGEAREAFQQALELAANTAQQEFLREQLALAASTPTDS